MCLNFIVFNIILWIIGTIDSQSAECPKTTQDTGDYFIHSNSRVSNVYCQDKTSITGKIQFKSNLQLVTINFEKLTNIGRFLQIESNVELTQIYFPKLKNVRNTILIKENAKLKFLEFPNLLSVDGTMDITHNLQLATISFPRLKTIGFLLRVLSNTEVTQINFPMLTNVTKSVWIGSQKLLGSIYFPALTYIGSPLNIRRNGLLSVVDIPRLTVVGLSFTFQMNIELKKIEFLNLVNIGGNIFIKNNSKLQSISLPKLKNINAVDIQGICEDSLSGSLDVCITYNDMLKKIEFPSLNVIFGSVNLQNNSNLHTILLCRLENFGGSLGIDQISMPMKIILCGEVAWNLFDIANQNLVVGCNNTQRKNCFPTVLPTKQPTQTNNPTWITKVISALYPPIPIYLIQSITGEHLSVHTTFSIIDQSHQNKTSHIDDLFIFITCGSLCVFLIIMGMIVYIRKTSLEHRHRQPTIIENSKLTHLNKDITLIELEQQVQPDVKKVDNYSETKNFDIDHIPPNVWPKEKRHMRIH